MTTINYSYNDSSVRYQKNSLLPIPAIYHESYLDKGNPFIEAIPFFSEEKKDVANLYTRTLNDLGITPSVDADVNRKTDEISQLRNIVLSYPFHSQVVSEWNLIMKASLRKRWEYFQNADYSVIVSNSRVEQHGIGIRIPYGDGDSGFTIVGPTNCGKTTAITTLLENIPRLLVHTFEKGTFLQIVWLNVTTPQGGSLQDLYVAIAAAVDEALGNFSFDENGKKLAGFYQTEISRERSVDAKARYVINLINRFCIGALILDEIQNMNFAKNASSSYRSLATIQNDTKVALVSIGLSDSINQLYTESYTLKRAGLRLDPTRIENDRDMDWIRLNTRTIMEHQWTKKHVQITDALIDAMLDASDMIIGDIVKIWAEVQKACIKASKNNPVEVTPELIMKKAELIAPVTALRRAEKARQLAELTSNADASRISDRQLKTAVIDDDLLSRVAAEAHRVLKLTNQEYSEGAVKESAQVIITRKTSSGLDFDSLVAKTIAYVRSSTKKRVRGKTDPKPSNIEPGETLQKYETEHGPVF